MGRWAAGIGAAMLALAAAGAEPDGPPPKLNRVETRYYVLYTDLDIDAAREACIRMDAMAEEYHRRTRGFSGNIRSKLPFYLYRRHEDYRNAGGLKGSAGVFTGDRLMAVAGNSPSAGTWHVIQHEGFHQFAHAVIRGYLPAWVNEGMAEYFGEAAFTGDGFVAGLIRPTRLQRVKALLRKDGAKPVAEMMRTTYEQWGKDIDIDNYDQAWSMIHFLVHGDNGRYVQPLSTFINDIGRGWDYERAWIKSFGRDIAAFEKRYREYWLDQPENPTADEYRRVVAATLTSFFARAAGQGQKFDSAEAFFQAAKDGSLRCHQLDWLPPALLKNALSAAPAMGTWSIESPPRRSPRLVCVLADGRRFVGAFAVQGGRVKSVQVDIEAVPDEPTAGGPATRHAR